MEIKARIESQHSGAVNINISEPINFEEAINFGLVGSTMAECYGAMVGAWVVSEKLKWMKIHPENVTLSLSFNDVVLTEYLLGETTPRDKDKRNDIFFCKRELFKFGAYKPSLYIVKKRTLKGSSTTGNIPSGIFPNINIVVEKDEETGHIIVTMPYNPALLAQFKSTFKITASSFVEYNEETEMITYNLPVTKEKFLWAWIFGIKGKSKGGPAAQKPKEEKPVTSEPAVANKPEKTVIGECPACPGGDILNKGKLYGCTNYKTDDSGCKFFVNTVIKGVNITEEDMRDLLQNGRTKKFDFKNQDGSTYTAALVIKGTKVFFEEEKSE